MYKRQDVLPALPQTAQQGVVLALTQHLLKEDNQQC